MIYSNTEPLGGKVLTQKKKITAPLNSQQTKAAQAARKSTGIITVPSSQIGGASVASQQTTTPPQQTVQQPDPPLRQNTALASPAVNGFQQFAGNEATNQIRQALNSTLTGQVVNKVLPPGLNSQAAGGLLQQIASTPTGLQNSPMQPAPSAPPGSDASAGSGRLNSNLTPSAHPTSSRQNQLRRQDGIAGAISIVQQYLGETQQAEESPSLWDNAGQFLAHTLFPLGSRVWENREVLADAPEIAANYLEGLFTGVGNAADFYPQHVRDARDAGARLNLFLTNPLIVASDYFTGDTGYNPPNQPGWELREQAAEKGRNNRPLNFIRYHGYNTLADWAETSRLVVDILDYIPRLNLQNISADLDAAAGSLRSDAELARERLIHKDNLLPASIAHKLLSTGQPFNDRLAATVLNIPLAVPPMLRVFSAEVNRAQNEGAGAIRQLARGFGTVCNKYLFNDLLSGFELTPEDRKLAEDVIKLISNNGLLLAAADAAPPDMMMPLMETAMEALIPLYDELIFSPDAPNKGEIINCTVNYLMDKLWNKLDQTLAEWDASLSGQAEDLTDEALLLPEWTDPEKENDYYQKTDDIPLLPEYNGVSEEDPSKPFVENPFDESGNLRANVTYVTGEYDYRYQTDEQGRICHVSAAVLQLKKHLKRLKNASDTFGKLAGDHAGHLIGDRFGGSNQLDNLVSQLSSLNLSGYKRLENQWAQALRRDQSVSVFIDVLYEGEDMRPSGFSILSIIDGEKTVFHFAN